MAANMKLMKNIHALVYIISLMKMKKEKKKKKNIQHYQQSYPYPMWKFSFACVLCNE